MDCRSVAVQQLGDGSAAPAPMEVVQNPEPGGKSYEIVRIADKLTKAIMNYVDNNDLRDACDSIINPQTRGEEMICNQVSQSICRLREADKVAILESIMELVHGCRQTDVNTTEIYEHTVDAILYHLMEKGLLNEGLGLASLVHTADNTLRSSINKDKWKFISEKWKNMGMKGIRHLFKALLSYQIKLPNVLSAAQKRQLRPVENLLAEILDTIPAIFTLTELHQFKANIYLHVFPRVVEKIAQIKAYCRPLADLVFVVGRSFMYPILSHPLFMLNSTAWKVDRSLTLLFSRLSYLPNRKELAMEQVYLFHMIMKQPRGVCTLNLMLNLVRVQGTRTFENVMLIMINEAMSAVEKLPPDKKIPRYQWDHLLSSIVMMAQSELGAIHGVIKSLKSILPKQNYTRARDEIMWLMLQVVGSFASQSKEFSDDIASLHKILYEPDMKSPTFGNDDPEGMYNCVRHLSTACMYILQENKISLPEPSAYLQTQIDFIRERAQDINITEHYLIAILTNAYRERTDPGRRVIMKIISLFDGPDNPNEEPFYLPYGRPANSILKPLDMSLIDSLAMRSKLHLMSRLGSFVKQKDKLPSPAYFESYCRLLYSMEFEFGVKSFGELITKVTQSIMSNSSTAPPELLRDTLYILLDTLANRLYNIPNNSGFRQTICHTLMSIIHHVSPQSHMGRELHALVEQILMKEFSWLPHTEIMRFSFEMLGKSKKEIDTRSVNMHIAHPEQFYSPSTDHKTFHVCPEIVRMLHMSIMRTAKIMDKDFAEEPEFLQHIASVFKWTPKQMRSFPATFRNIAGAVEDSTDCKMNEDTYKEIHSNYMQMRGIGDPYVNYIEQHPEQKPTVLCCIYRSIMENTDTDMYNAYYQILNNMSPRHITIAINCLVEYVIHQMSESQGQDMLKPIGITLLNMIFHKHMIPFEKILLAFVLHPNNDSKAKIGLLFVFALLHSEECKARINFYVQRVPLKHLKPKEFFEGNAEFHKQFPEYTYQELMNTPPGQIPVINPKCHPPIYFGSLIDRLLPILDAIVTRSLEMELSDQDMVNLFLAISPVYKYHPNIFSFVYTLLHTQHEIIGHSAIARVFVNQLIGVRRPTGGNSSYLTLDYIQYNHQHRPFEAVVELLIGRIIECSEFVIEPPEYVEPDWRTAELSASAQALFLACIELMASPHDASKTIPALISVLWKSEKVYTRPYATLNAIGQLLTALPAAYAKELNKTCAEVLEQHRLSDLTFEDIVYDNFEENVLLRTTNREMTINYVLQAYWHHANQNNVSQFTEFFLNDIYDKITTENELWYFLRLMIPLQQYVFETKIKHFYPDCIQQAKGVMTKLGQLCEGPDTLEHGPEICDVLYHLKYQCLGDSLNNEAMELQEKLPAPLRARFKYYILSNKDQEPATGPKMSTIVEPDRQKLFKTRSDAI